MEARGAPRRAGDGEMQSGRTRDLHRYQDEFGLSPPRRGQSLQISLKGETKKTVI